MNTPAITDFSQFAGLRAAARNDDPAALRETAKQFEALFTQQLLKSMRAAKLGDDAMGGTQGEFYQQMFDQQLSLQMASGKGLGIADLLVRQLQTSRAAVVAAPTPALAEPAAALPLATSTPRFAPASAGDFIDSIRPHAEKAAAALGVPAETIMAQAALETGWGKHLMHDAGGKPSYNFFGIKAGSNWDGERMVKGTQEYRDGAMRSEQAAFRSYASVEEGFAGYVDFIRSNPRYAEALRAAPAGGYAAGLQQAGYATDPAYAAKLQRIAASSAITAPRTMSV